jgi:hypothetical protein
MTGVVEGLAVKERGDDDVSSVRVSFVGLT